MPEKVKRILDTYVKAEARAAPGGKMFIDGMIPYGSLSEEMWGFREIVAPGAFARTLNNGTDVFAFWAHDNTRVLASRKAGTLTLDDQTDGLHFSVELRDTEAQADLFETVARGDCNGVSFGFIAEVDEWDNKADPAIRTLKEVRLLEISPGVAFPAYPAAQSDAARRSLYAEGGPEFRSKFRPANAPAPATPPAPESTPGPSAPPAPEARTQPEDEEKRRMRAKLAIIRASEVLA